MNTTETEEELKRIVEDLAAGMQKQGAALLAAQKGDDDAVDMAMEAFDGYFYEDELRSDPHLWAALHEYLLEDSLEVLFRNSEWKSARAMETEGRTPDEFRITVGVGGPNIYIQGGLINYHGECEPDVEEPVSIDAYWGSAEYHKTVFPITPEIEAWLYSSGAYYIV